jgi:hypothetical protein
MIRDALLDQILRDGAPTLRILKYPVDVESTYAFMPGYIDDIWSGRMTVFKPESELEEKVKIDIMLHMGMRRSDDNFCLESLARRDAFTGPDVEDKHWEHPEIWHGLSETLRPGFDIRAIGEEVKKRLPVRFTKIDLDTESLLNTCFRKTSE